MKGVAAMLQNSIIDIFRAVRLEERDQKRFKEWRNERVIAMLRLGLTVGAAMTILVHFGDRFVDVEVASRLLPYRLLVAVFRSKKISGATTGSSAGRIRRAAIR